MYVTVNFDEDSRPFEVFTALGKAGGCDSANLESISRLISLALRSGIDPDQVVAQLRGITCCPVWDGGTMIRSTPDAVAMVLSRHLEVDDQALLSPRGAPGGEATAQLGLFPSAKDASDANGRVLSSGARCPDCSAFLIHQEGCLRCLDCGYTKCE